MKTSVNKSLLFESKKMSEPARLSESTSFSIPTIFPEAKASTISFFQPPACPYTKSPTMEQLFMKALLKNIPIFLMTVAMIFMISCSSTTKRESAGEYLDDTVITTRVKAAILAEDSLKVSEINVETFKGVVQLSGFVSSRDDRSKAVSVAKNVKGVESVKNDIRLK